MFGFGFEETLTIDEVLKEYVDGSYFEKYSLKYNYINALRDREIDKARLFFLNDFTDKPVTIDQFKISSELIEELENKELIKEHECMNSYDWDFPVTFEARIYDFSSKLTEYDKNESSITRICLIYFHYGADVRGGYFYPIITDNSSMSDIFDEIESNYQNSHSIFNEIDEDNTFSITSDLRVILHNFQASMNKIGGSIIRELDRYEGNKFYFDYEEDILNKTLPDTMNIFPLPAKDEDGDYWGWALMKPDEWEDLPYDIRRKSPVENIPEAQRCEFMRMLAKRNFDHIHFSKSHNEQFPVHPIYSLFIYKDPYISFFDIETNEFVELHFDDFANKGLLYNFIVNDIINKL